MSPDYEAVDGIVFAIFMALAAFLGRETVHFTHPHILWCFFLLLLFNLLDLSVLPKRLAQARRRRLSVLANTLLVSLVVLYSGGRESPYWPTYLLPVFHGAVYLETRGVALMTAVAVGFLGVFHGQALAAGESGGTFEFLTKAAAIVLAAWVVSRVARRERESRERLATQERRLNEEREQMRHTMHHMDRLATLGTLTSSVAHELNSPLSSILGFSQVALECLKEDGELRDSLRRIEANAKRCRRVMEDMLAFSRRKTAAREAADINALVRECVALKKYDWLGTEVRVEEEYDFVDMTIEASGSQIQQVVFNLLTNAYQVLRSAEVAAGLITVRTARAGGEARIVVEDNGPGIPAEALERIWEPFFTTKEKGQGTGLGLSIARQIVEAHGGRITVESVPQAGACFMVHLPVRPAPASKSRHD